MGGEEGSFEKHHRLPEIHHNEEEVTKMDLAMRMRKISTASLQKCFEAGLGVSGDRASAWSNKRGGQQMRKKTEDCF